VNYDNSLVVTITMTCNLRAPSSDDHLFTCGAIYLPPHYVAYFIEQTNTIHSVDTGFPSNTKYSCLILYVIGWWWTAWRQGLHKKVFSQQPQLTIWS